MKPLFFRRRDGERSIMLLDVAVVVSALILVALLQLSIMHRNAVFAQEETCRKQLKWIARAEERYYASHAEYADTFRKLAPFFSDLNSFLCPTSHEVYSLGIDEVGRYMVECQFAGHGAILSGDPDWE